VHHLATYGLIWSSFLNALSIFSSVSGQRSELGTPSAESANPRLCLAVTPNLPRAPGEALTFQKSPQFFHASFRSARESSARNVAEPYLTHPSLRRADCGVPLRDSSSHKS